MLVITGMSGAGRSTAADALEDIGWYVVDNLPPRLLQALADLIDINSQKLLKLAAVVDIRGGDFLLSFREIANKLRSIMHFTVIFLDSNENTLIRRFEMVRRPHPLQGSGTISDGIRKERKQLLSMLDESDILIDTSDLNVKQLANLIKSKFANFSKTSMTVTLLSFGFKYGIPADADMVFDSRFLPNPYWENDLKVLTGENIEVIKYVLNFQQTKDFIQAVNSLIKQVLSGYKPENKGQITLAIGCTGGKHRSVVLVNELARFLTNTENIHTTTIHRDLGKE